jgi:RNA polymerase sigma-70 factor (ECF subfamily)
MGDVFNFRGFGRLARITSKRIVPINGRRSGYLTEKQFCNVLMFYDDEMTEADAGLRIETYPWTTQNSSQAVKDPDHLLVRRVQEGRMDAFDALVGKYKQPLISFATRALGDPMEAQDIAQNAFVRVFKVSGRFRFTCRFSTWLYAITRNLCRNELRRRSRHRTDFLRHEEIEAQEFARWHLGTTKFGTVPDAVFHKELEEKIEQALELLSERERTAILLLQHEDLSYADVAAVLGTSHSATKNLIHRGRQTLKRELQPYLSTGAWRASWAEAVA